MKGFAVEAGPTKVDAALSRSALAEGHIRVKKSTNTGTSLSRFGLAEGRIKVKEWLSRPLLARRGESVPANDDAPKIPRLLSIADVATLLDVDVRHVRRLVQERRIPFIKWGHLLRFDPAEIARWLDRWRRPERGDG